MRLARRRRRRRRRRMRRRMEGILTRSSLEELGG